jgi:hypothetical protein
MNNNSNKRLTILVVIAVLVLGYVVFVNKTTAPVAPEPVPVVSGNINDLVSFSVSPNQIVSGAMVLNGSVKGGYFFEANIVIKIMDMSNNVLLTTFGTATTDWMTAGPVSFTTNVNFTGLPVGPAKLVIENDNPSGDPMYLKQIFIPIVIQ